MYKKLIELKAEFYTYQLKEKKPLRVVIKGLPRDLEIKLIEDDLKNQGYLTQKISKLKEKNGIETNMVFVELERIYKTIYNLQKVIRLNVRIESLRNKGEDLQCHRC